MTTPQLPPEIKSAEEFHGELNCSGDTNLIHQRDRVIWNAAIEKAAEYCKSKATKDGAYLEMSEAIINLKLKK